METVTISRSELKKLMKDTFVDVLTHRRDLIEDAVVEAIEDIGLAISMEQGRTGEYIDNEEFLKKLKRRIRSKK